MSGQLHGGTENAELALAAWQHAGGQAANGSGHEIALGPYCMACSLWMLGYPDRALQVARDAVALASTLSHPLSLELAVLCEMVIHSLRRDRVLQRSAAQQLGELAELQDNLLLLSVGRAYEAAADRHDSSAPGKIFRSLMQAMSTMTFGSAPQMIALLADVQHGLGRHVQALEKLDLALDLAKQTGQHFWDAELHRLRGTCLLCMEGSDLAAEQCFGRALDVARLQNAKSWELRAATDMARLWSRQGKTREAVELLRPVYDWFSEGFDTPDLEAAATVLRKLKD